MESLICRLDDDCEKLLTCKLDLDCKKTLHFDSESSMIRVSIYALHHPCNFPDWSFSGNILKLLPSPFHIVSFYLMAQELRCVSKMAKGVLILLNLAPDKSIIVDASKLNEGYLTERGPFSSQNCRMTYNKHNYESRVT